MTRCREPVPLGHYDGSNAEDTNNGEVDKSRLRGTVEGVVQPGHKGAHNQEGNARVVKPERGGNTQTTAHFNENKKTFGEVIKGSPPNLEL